MHTLLDLKVGDEVMYNNHYATIKEISEHTVKIACGLFDSLVWVSKINVKSIER